MILTGKGQEEGRIGAHKECNRALSAPIGVVGMGVLGGKNAEAKPEVSRTPTHPKAGVIPLSG